MTSEGQDIRPTNDAMWIETILHKFPRDIVKPVLIEMREKEDLMVEQVTNVIDKEVSAKSYIHSRTQPHFREFKKNSEQNTVKIPQKCVICEKFGHYPWQCWSSLTVAERRKIVIGSGYVESATLTNIPVNNALEITARCAVNLITVGCVTPAKTRKSTHQLAQYATATFPNNGRQQEEQRNNNNFAKIRNANDVYRSGSGAPRNRYDNANSERNKTKTITKAGTQSHSHFTDNPTTATSESHATIENSHNPRQNEQIVLMTAVGNIWNHNTGTFEKATFFFDTGAQKTIIQEDFAFKLGLPMLRNEQCVMSGIGGKIETFESNVIHVKIGTAYGKDLKILIQKKPVLTNGFPAVKLCTMDQDFLQERNILFCNPHIRGELHTPQVIVGLDYYYNFVLENGDIYQTPSGLRMANTIFGPTIYGRGLLEAQNDACMTMITHGMTAIDETEYELLTKLFELEGVGISPNENAESSHS